jgi:hypothetical protein
MGIELSGPEPTGSGPFSFRHRSWLVFCATTLLVVLTGVGILILGRWTSERVRQRVVHKLSARFQSDVELRALTFSFFPQPTVSGQGLVLRQHGRRDVPPLIVLESFEAHTGWRGLLANHVADIQLHGLQITSPPKGAVSASPQPGAAAAIDIPTVGRIVADGTILTRIPKQPGKLPLEWRLEQLTITDVDRKGAMKYRTKLDNAIPPGLIEAAGHFGPWNAAEPGDTLLDGDYTFRDANLGVFKGIAGTLSAKGKFSGALATIQTHGTTDTPDFVVDTGGHPVHLATEFDALVDGTDGNTYLHSVRASFGRTVMIAKGAIEAKPGGHGKDIRLDIHTEKARVEDILKLATKAAKPVMNGDMTFATKFFLPSGPRHVLDKLNLDGQFSISGAHFPEGQSKVDTLSRKGQGQPTNEAIVNVAAELRGSFHLRESTMGLTGVQFAVPGAEVDVDGSYRLHDQEMAFSGHLYIDAPVSKTMTGIKSWLLKMADPLFKNKNGKGSRIPFEISGTPEDPRLGFDLMKVFRRE